jgi:hypothetical protein
VVTDPPVFLSRLLGRSVRSSDGVQVVRVVDMTVLYDIAHPGVHPLGVGRGRRIRYLLPWRLVQTYRDKEVSLSIDRIELSAYASAPDPTMEDRELLLARDVLDTQVVDLVGRRLSRVSDVLTVAGRDGAFEVGAVDVGVGSLLRRMGFPGWETGSGPSPSTGLNCISRPVRSPRPTRDRGHRAAPARGVAARGAAAPAQRRQGRGRRPDHPPSTLRRGLAREPSRTAAPPDSPFDSPRVLQRLLDAAPPALARLLAELHASPPPARRQLRTSGWRIRRPSKTTPRPSPGDRR